MRILYLHQYVCPPGGSGNNRSYELARTWVDVGHEVTFITSRAYFPPEMDMPTSGDVDIDGIHLKVLDTPYAHEMPFRQRIKAWIAFYRKAKAAARNMGPFDLIYASSTPLTMGELGRRLSRKWGTPYVFETVDVWPDVPIGMGIVRNKALIWLLHGLTNRIYKQSQLIVALSEGMREQVLSHGVPGEKVVVVHNGTNPQVFSCVERPARETCQVIYTGTVGLANGLDALVDAAERIQSLGREDIRFLVLGQGNDHARVLAYAKDKQVRNVVFQDRVPKEEVPKLLEASDVGLVCFASHPVLEANSANKFYDYLASCLPVVTNYRGWQAKYIEEYGCGLSARQGDLEELVAHILFLADHPERRLEMGGAGRKLVEERFDRAELAGRLLRIFEAAVKNYRK